MTKKRSKGKKKKEIPDRHGNRIISILLEIAMGEGILVVMNYLCYSDYRWMLPMQILLIPYFQILKRRKELYRIHQYEKGFREILQSMMTSLQTGYSVENACKTAWNELQSFYQNRNNPVLNEWYKIIYGIELKVPIEDLFMNFAVETGLEDVYQFSVVLAIGRNTGGNMVEILKNSMEHLQGKMDTNAEVQVILSGKKFEKNIMLLMPLCILLYLRVTNPDYISCLYTTVSGKILITVSLFVIVVCYYWTEYIMKIEF